MFSKADATKDENKNFEDKSHTPMSPEDRSGRIHGAVRQEEQVSYDNSGCEHSKQIFVSEHFECCNDRVRSA